MASISRITSSAMVIGGLIAMAAILAPIAGGSLSSFLAKSNEITADRAAQNVSSREQNWKTSCSMYFEASTWDRFFNMREYKDCDKYLDRAR